MNPGDRHPDVIEAAGSSDEAVASDTLELRYNENPLGPSQAAIDAVQRYAPRMHRYPGDPIRELRTEVAAWWDVDPGQVWLGPGAVGVIDVLSRACIEPGERILRPDPGFGYFARSSRLHRGGDDTYPLRIEENFRFDPETVLDVYDGQPLLYINTPHNPTGATVDHDDIETVADAVDASTLVIVDEAYEPFAKQDSAVNLLQTHPNVTLLRTFSKSDGLAGMRVGYAIVSPATAESYANVHSAFSVSALSCVAADAALHDVDHRDRSIDIARTGRTYMHEHIEARTWPSQGNFVLVEVGDAEAITDELETHGILVRSGDRLGVPSAIRITVGTPAQTRRAVEELNRVIGSCASR